MLALPLVAVALRVRPPQALPAVAAEQFGADLGRLAEAAGLHQRDEAGEQGNGGFGRGCTGSASLHYSSPGQMGQMGHNPIRACIILSIWVILHAGFFIHAWGFVRTVRIVPGDVR